MIQWRDAFFRLQQGWARLRDFRLPAWLHTPGWMSHWSWASRAALGVAVLAAYYLGGAWWVDRVDTSLVTTQASSNVGPHYSRAILAASQLSLREVDQHHWTPADPFFLPGYVLTEMPRFQQGLMATVARFAESLSVLDGGADSNLAKAAGLYKYPGTVWRVASGVSWLPTAPSSRQYRIAAHAFEDYDNELNKLDQPSILQQLSGLSAILDGVGADLDGIKDRLERHLDGEPSVLFDGDGRALFHTTRGHLYAWSIILTELGKDDADLIAEHGLTTQWRHTIDIMMKSAYQNPAIFTVGDGIVANHLAEQGYALLRARALVSEMRAGLIPHA